MLAFTSNRHIYSSLRLKPSSRIATDVENVSSNRLGNKTFHLKTIKSRDYSSVRRRNSSDKNDFLKNIYTSERPDLTEKRKKALDKDFDDTFFRKPKVLIIGTDIAAMTAALSLSNYNVTPDILDVGHYMHPMYPSNSSSILYILKGIFQSFISIFNSRGMILSMSAMRTFENLGIRRHIEAIGSPIKIYGRTDNAGSSIATVNFDSLRIHQDYPTLGVNRTELERVLQDLVSSKMQIQPQCVVSNIESPPLPDERLARVTWNSNFMTSRESKSGYYDCVIISDGTFSASRESHFPNAYSIDAPVHLWETVIPRPKAVMKGYSADQWGLDRRVGFFPVEHPNRDLIYVYAQTRIPKGVAQPTQEKIPTTRFLEHFQDFSGAWKDIADVVSTQKNVNSTVVIDGSFVHPNTPVSGRVVALGEAASTFATPCLGHEVSAMVDSAHYLSNVIAFTSTPMLVGLIAYQERYQLLQQMASSAKMDVRASTLMESRLPRFFQKFMIKQTFSDRGLIAQEKAWNGLDQTKEELDDMNPLKRLGTMRKEWYDLTDEERFKAKEELRTQAEEASKAYQKMLMEQRQKQVIAEAGKIKSAKNE